MVCIHESFQPGIVDPCMRRASGVIMPATTDQVEAILQFPWLWFSYLVTTVVWLPVIQRM